MIQLDNLPDEILMMIFNNMCQADVLYSLIDVNQRLNTIVHDPIFTNHLTLLEHSSDHFIHSLTDSMLDQFCLEILPKIKHKIKWLDLEPLSMERILLATNYPCLYGLTLYNIDLRTCIYYFFELHVTVNNFDDCLYLLDGHFNELRKFHVNISDIHSAQLTINNRENLPNLKCFSLYSNIETSSYDELIVPLLHRMINLEELGLYVKICDKNIFVDGHDLKKNIINKLLRLKKIQFYIRSTIGLNQINLPSNEDIQYTFEDFHDNHIISYIDYFSDTQQGRCHIYSYPYTLCEYYKITNNFPGGLFKCVSKISLYDERPFQHEFFLRIAQSFPFVKKLSLENMKPRNDKKSKNSEDDNQILPIIEYHHLTTLDLTEAHLDYIELFLLDTKMRLSNNVYLVVIYQALRRVTEKFTRNATRINGEKLHRLSLLGKYRIPKYVKEYFPHTEILNY
ncbi:unnamed protein product [Rotaria sordida]|uniref:F-box domain-containing protein n=1 Tax=Rotaria sordida TaxID=392033 RepID=A0A815U9N8_9BILA|nr:unnamed protein product [Rotaria sordida]